MKAFTSDGASVMIGVNEGVVAKLRMHECCRCMLNFHCICHRLALACSDTCDYLYIMKEFETTLSQLWSFFKDSPKRVCIYVKEGMKLKEFDNASNKKKIKNSEES